LETFKKDKKKSDQNKNNLQTQKVQTRDRTKKKMETPVSKALEITIP